MHLSLILNGNISLQKRKVTDCRNLTLCFQAGRGKHHIARDGFQNRGFCSLSKNSEKPEICDVGRSPQPDAHHPRADRGKAEDPHFSYAAFIACIQQQTLCPPLPRGETPLRAQLPPSGWQRQGRNVPETQHPLFNSDFSVLATNPFPPPANFAQTFRMCPFL